MIRIWEVLFNDTGANDNNGLTVSDTNEVGLSELISQLSFSFNRKTVTHVSLEESERAIVIEQLENSMVSNLATDPVIMVKVSLNSLSSSCLPTVDMDLSINDV